MQHFAYKARDEQGKVVKGVLSAQDENELFSRLRGLGLFLTSSKVSTARLRSGGPAAEGKLSQKEVLTFTTQVAISLEAGVPLLTVLKDMAKNSKDKKTRDIMADISGKVESGQTFRDALGGYPSSFSDLYVNLIGAGESTGKLSFVLEDLARLIEWQLELQSKVKEASVYPIVLSVAMIGVVTVLMAVVIPKFIPLFEELKVDIPLPTRMVILFSQFWYVPFILLALAAGAVFALSRFDQGKYMIDKMKLRLPVFGDLTNKIALSRFCHTFALSLRSGVNVFNALGIASEVTGNRYLATAISKAKSYVNVGDKISDAMEKAAKEGGGKFPDMVIRMISVGEQSGTLPDTLEKVNQFYDKEVPSTIKKIFAMMEPAMILFMGVVVGGIAVSVFLPLIKIISTVGGD